MSGYYLTEGLYIKRTLNDEQMWRIIKTALSSRSKHSSSYKFAFFKSLLDNLYIVDKDYRLSFDVIFNRFTEMYWGLVKKYNLKQNNSSGNHRETYLEQIFFKVSDKYLQDGYVPFKSLSEEVQRKICYNVKLKCKAYVVGALYSDMGKSLYSFSKNEEWIMFNPSMHEFLCQNRKVIEQLNKYEWARFMERTNCDNPVINLVTDLLNFVGLRQEKTMFALYQQILEMAFNDNDINFEKEAGIGERISLYEVVLEKCEDLVISKQEVPINTIELLFDAEEKLRLEKMEISDVNTNESTEPDIEIIDDTAIDMLADPETLIKLFKQKKAKDLS